MASKAEIKRILSAVRAAKKSDGTLPAPLKKPTSAFLRAIRSDSPVQLNNAIADWKAANKKWKSKF